MEGEHGQTEAGSEEEAQNQSDDRRLDQHQAGEPGAADLLQPQYAGRVPGQSEGGAGGGAVPPQRRSTHCAQQDDHLESLALRLPGGREAGRGAAEGRKQGSTAVDARYGSFVAGPDVKFKTRS